jgi:hypothetical protein
MSAHLEPPRTGTSAPIPHPRHPRSGPRRVGAPRIARFSHTQAKARTVVRLASGRSGSREPVLEAIDVQRAIAEYPDLGGGRFPF